jgi:sugar phosphate permease
VNLALILRDRRLHPVVIAGVIMVSLQFILLAQFMVFATTQLRMSLSMAGALFGLVQTSGIAGRLLLAWFSDAKLDGDRVGPLRLAALASACSLTAVALLGDRLPVGIFVVLCGSLGFFGIGWYSLFIVHVAECAPSDAVARTLSCALTLNQVAIVVSPVAFGALVGASGSYRVAWLVLAALVGGAVVPLRPRHRRTARALRRQSRNE